jgi:branched-chain amino acid transport system ATP-binding protein
MNHLRCENIHKSYGGVKVLLGVDFEIRSGEVLGLLGTNGAGKSTLIDIISGVTPPGSGAVYLGGREARGSGGEIRAYQGLARTFQHPQVAKDLTLRENVLIGAGVDELNGLSRVFGSALGGFFKGWGGLNERVERVCADVALHDIDRLAGEVTFGELRLIEVARVLMQKPKVVLLDEPFSGVGDSGIQGIIHSLGKLKAAGAAILLVDHNIDILAPQADRMALLAQGSIVVEGDVRSCLDSPVFRETYIGVSR